MKKLLLLLLPFINNSLLGENQNQPKISIREFIEQERKIATSALEALEKESDNILQERIKCLPQDMHMVAMIEVVQEIAQQGAPTIIRQAIFDKICDCMNEKVGSTFSEKELIEQCLQHTDDFIKKEKVAHPSPEDDAIAHSQFNEIKKQIADFYTS